MSTHGGHTLQITNLLAAFDDIVMLEDEKYTTGLETWSRLPPQALVHSFLNP
jgi:hypothetical protein